MSYEHPEIKAFKGLYVQANSFSVPDGALEVADNVVISQDGVITKRRGFSVFSQPSGTFNTLFFYQGVLIALYNNHIVWVDTSGVQTTDTPYTGVSVLLSGGRVGRSVQANSNLYFTTDNGILKLEAYNGTVYSAGTPPALDLRARFLPLNGPIGDGSSTGTTIGSTEVGWRVTFGRLDSNGNLLESAPSDISGLTLSQLSGSVSGSGTTVTYTATSPLPSTLVTGMLVTISGATPTGFNGTFAITTTGASTFTFANVTAGASSTAVIAGWSQQAILEFSIPSEIQDTSYFYRIYRSSQSLSSASAFALDFKLIKQTNLVAGDLTARVVFFTDTIIDLFQSSAAELYTNPNSQQGELQAATRPPLAQDVTFYKNHTFYANTTSRHSLSLALVSVSLITTATDTLTVTLGTTRTYKFYNGVGNSTVTATASGTTTITVTYTAHGMATGWTIYVSNVTGSVPNGTYTITVTGANTFQFTSASNTASQLDFQGVTDGTNGVIQLVPAGASPATALDATARGIVKAIDRDTNSLIYARYSSTPQDIPGKLYFEAKGFGNAFTIASTTPTAFSPVLPQTSVNNVLPNTIFTSKIGEPESVPIVNTLPIGSKSKQILRVIALRDCCIVIKEDGIFRIDGDRVSNFISTVLDSTVFCLVPSSAGLIDNTVMMLSNQGVVKISSASVQIVSYKIEQLFRPILGDASLVATTSAVTYESERLYLLATLVPNQSSKATAGTVYCYNTLSDCWTTWDTIFVNGIVGPGDVLHLISSANVLVKERKQQNKIDYCGQDYSVSIISVAANNLSAVIFPTGIVPQSGDIIILNSVISRIKTVTVQAPNYLVTFYQATNLVAGTATYYAQYAATIKFAPFHAGQVNRSKQFSQFQVHLRDSNASLFAITFSGDTFGASETVNWDATLAGNSQAGWGGAPWGLFPWGLDQGINLTYTTQPAPIVRTYVPRFAQRSTFIQALLVHATAGERLGIQEIGYTVRGYGERVTK